MGKRPGFWRFVKDRVRVQLGFSPHEIWPCAPGAFVSKRGTNFVGTLGCFARCRLSSRSFFAVTCQHVVNHPGHPGDVIDSAPRQRGPWHRLGRVDPARRQKLHQSIDVAFIESQRRFARNAFPGIGRIAKRPVPESLLKPGAALSKWGAETRLTHGTLSGVFRLRLTRWSPQQTGYSGGLHGQAASAPEVAALEIEPLDEVPSMYGFCLKGDSGALVFTTPKDGSPTAAVGVLFAADTKICPSGFCVMLDEVLAHAGLSLA